MFFLLKFIFNPKVLWEIKCKKKRATILTFLDFMNCNKYRFLFKKSVFFDIMVILFQNYFLRRMEAGSEEGVCQVCEQSLPKVRVHYGGITCYSCRAFFRSVCACASWQAALLFTKWLCRLLSFGRYYEQQHSLDLDNYCHWR